MSELININGTVHRYEQGEFVELDVDEFFDQFVEFLEARSWQFNGVIKVEDLTGNMKIGSVSSPKDTDVGITAETRETPRRTSYSVQLSE